ncbi:MAG: class I SAM-dependent methyltransferase [Flavobacteriales bacterium]|nr:class I SAM-dependent methyltransferase [Flavobacteriales bacterium]MCB9168332.1 class I SAM-dependent methyltransferase [Flavobacteriales bacterium]
MASFNDHFSSVAASYAAYRPRYPQTLFTWLATLVEERERALDVGTGNGQAAVMLAPHFRKVIATDASAEQIAHARERAGVRYQVAAAHESGLPDASVDLVTAATAAHWFDHALFNAEVVRVLRPGGVLAIWHYLDATVDERIDAILLDFRKLIAPHWPLGRMHVEDGYSTLPFPFPDMGPLPAFACHMHWTADQLLGYVATWSALPKAREVLGKELMVPFAWEVREAWGEGTREVLFPISMRVGRK